MRSELLKLRYSRLTWIVGIALLAMMVAGHVIVIGVPYFIPWMIRMNDVIPNFTAADQMSDEQLALMSFENSTAQWQVADIAGSSTGLVGIVTAGVALLAALSIAAEYRHDSISSTVQLEPRRPRVLLQKLGAVAIVTSILTLALIAVSAAGLWIGTTMAGIGIAMTIGELFIAWLSSWIVLLLIAFVGFGVGLVVRGQLFSVAVILGLALLESILRPVSTTLFGGPTAIAALPFGLAHDVTGNTSILTGQNILGFASGAAMLLLLAWAIVVVVGAGVLFQRRDVVGRG